VRGPDRGNRYHWAAAVLLPVAATIVDAGLRTATGPFAPFLPYFPALLAVAIWGGRGPGYLALVLSAVASAAFWLSPPGGFLPPPVPRIWILLAGFIAASAMMVELAARARTLRRRGESLAQALANELARRRLAESALRASETRLTLALQAAAMGTWEYDLATRRVFASERMREIVGTPKPQGGIDCLLARLHPDDRSMVDHSFASAVSGDDKLEAEFRLEEQGTVRWVSVKALKVCDEDGVERLVGVGEDITARREVLEEIERSREELRAADRQKDEFLATLAHELRNPMAPIRYAAALLRPDASGEVVAQVRAIVERQSAQMARLLDDLLDMGRITRGVIRLQRAVVDLGPLVSDAVESTRMALDAADLELHLVLPESPVWVDGDPVRLVQVTGNLVGNAVKYSPAGGRVEVRLATEGGNAKLVVRDDGVGFEPELAPRLFQLFSQLHPGIQAAQGGLGIGLAVVQRLVELHGGRVHAHSDGPGRGATFTVELGLAQAPSSPVVREVSELTGTE
jgi:PAS domain S-box-containing protein